MGYEDQKPEEKKEADAVDKTVATVAGATLGYTVGAAVVGTALGIVGVATAPAWVPAALAVGGGYAAWRWMKG